MLLGLRNLRVEFDRQTLPVSTMPVRAPELEKAGLELWVRREDLIHPLAGGNKWRKLKYNFRDFLFSGRPVMGTFGGSWSNHVAALAYAGAQYGFRTAAVIRGEPATVMSPTLIRAERQGMELIFVSRTAYRDRYKAPESLFTGYDPEDVFVVPEGGCNEAGFRGCLEIVNEIDQPFDILCCPCGTGTTLAGLTVSTGKKVLGFAVLKNRKGIYDAVEGFLGTPPEGLERRTANYAVNHEFHFGGYARSSPVLDAFVRKFTVDHGIPAEPVYTGKMFYGIFELARRGFFKRGSIIMALHTGGLQYLEDV